MAAESRCLVTSAVVVAYFAAPAIASPAPEQPIAFSHAAHVGRRHISCVYCHATVTTTAHATIPSTETCMGCHRVVMVTNPEVQKLAQAYLQQRPIRWIRVTNLPDFVHFTHRRHIKAGVACSSCHGDVASMVRVQKDHALTMGECLACHQQRRVSTDCYTCHY